VAEIDWRIWDTPANFNGFCGLASLLQRRRSSEVNQTLHDVWLSPGLVHCIYIFGGYCPLTEFCQPGAIFTLHPILALYIGRVTARHSCSGHQPVRHSAEGTTYIRQGSHHVGHRPAFYLMLNHAFAHFCCCTYCTEAHGTERC